MSEIPSSKNWSKDVDLIRKTLQEKERFAKSEKSIEKKEIVKEIVSQTILAPQEDKKEKQNFPEKPLSSLSDLGPSLPTEEEKELLKKAIEIAKKEGILKGYQVSVSSKNPWLIDAFHDKIAEEILKEL